ncbi:MAG: hypothetical protein B7Z66_03175 [Chromatiales bacterium 21-64-14]|nr:MAG: hypothetical protein B7Z66_03175 [Chromatiales bacterium 21-64-14]HQU15860.1 PepSY domain-containing protein [Gammaproteobacteria bacterium]
MNRSFRNALLVTAVLVTALASPVASARPGLQWYAESVPQLADAGGISLGQAVSRVRRATGGRVLSAEVRERDGNAVYRIKILTPRGQVRVVLVDPRTGEILN